MYIIKELKHSIWMLSPDTQGKEKKGKGETVPILLLQKPESFSSDQNWHNCHQCTVQSKSKWEVTRIKWKIKITWTVINALVCQSRTVRTTFAVRQRAALLIAKCCASESRDSARSSLLKREQVTWRESCWQGYVQNAHLPSLIRAN